ncbi:hypothetical protein [Endozoicomonas sp.]|uniref:hypothetical protein n=1 Tax=Endozoicomonas sp. TaxID=1892382 RepID=UPI002885DA95|nr:hypothetical protein [Endozoicomonas sp.]
MMNHQTEEAYVLDLIERLKPHLPMTGSPGKGLIATYKANGTNGKLRKNHNLAITAAHYLGLDGGLCLAYKSPIQGDLNDMVVSITHLKLDHKHPFYKELRAYQIGRISWLAQQPRSSALLTHP